MRRTGEVWMKEHLAGKVWQDEDGYWFQYELGYLEDLAKPSVSVTLPKRDQPYHSKTMLPFFDGLIPEGWLLEVVVSNWKINPRDRMSLLLTVCRDCIGAVSILAIPEEKIHE